MTDETAKFGSGEFGQIFGGGGPSRSFNAMISDVMLSCGINKSDEPYREVIVALANEAYKTILKGRHWVFLNKEMFLNTREPYALGTIKTVQDSHVVVEDSVDVDGVRASKLDFNVTHVGQLLIPAGLGEVYRVNKLINNKEIEIVPQWVQPDTELVGYQIANDRIRIDAKVQDLKSLIVLGNREIKPMGLQQFRVIKSSDPTRTGIPEIFTIVDQEDESGGQTIEMFPSPDKNYGYHVEYTEQILWLEDSETCYPQIPPQHGDVFTLAMRAKVYEDQNNVTMAQLVGGQAAQAWARMAGDQELTDSRARIQPGRNYFNRRGRNSSRYVTREWKID